jgi:hypothetical protein
MALTESTMLALGSEAPDFALPEVVSGNIIRLDDFRGTTDALVVMFICAHCPYVKHVEQGLAAFGRDYLDKPVGIVAISSNDAIATATTAPNTCAAIRRLRLHLRLPLRRNAGSRQGLPSRLHARLFPLRREMRLVYRGQFDASRPGSSIPVTGEDLRAALDAVLAGKPVSTDQKPSIGCNIKWK